VKGKQSEKKKKLVSILKSGGKPCHGESGLSLVTHKERKGDEKKKRGLSSLRKDCPFEGGGGKKQNASLPLPDKGKKKNEVRHKKTDKERGGATEKGGGKNSKKGRFELLVWLCNGGGEKAAWDSKRGGSSFRT